MDRNEEYQLRVTVGQAINLANEYILKCNDVTKLTKEQYKKLLQEKTVEFKQMIESIQNSYTKAIEETEKIVKEIILKEQDEEMYDL